MNMKPALAFAGALILASACRLCAIEARDFSDQTRWVLTLDLRAAHASPMLAFAADQIDAAKRQEAERKLAAVEAMFGVNLKKDIDHIVIAGNGDASKGGVAYVYGRFDAQRLTTILAGASEYSTSNHHGTVVQRWRDDSDKKKKCMAFAKPGSRSLPIRPSRWRRLSTCWPRAVPASPQIRPCARRSRLRPATC